MVGSSGSVGQHNHVRRSVMLRCWREGVVPDVRATATNLGLLGYFAHENGAACFGFPESVIPVPRGFSVVKVDVAGGGEFGAYAIRRPGVRGGSRAADVFWDDIRRASGTADAGWRRGS